jgi:hypothetical protein
MIHSPSDLVERGVDRRRPGHHLARLAKVGRSSSATAPVYPEHLAPYILGHRSGFDRTRRATG